MRWPTSTATIADALKGYDAADQTRSGRQADRARRHPEQGPPGRQRAARRLDGGRPCRGRLARAAAVAVPVARQARHAAGADDEHHQRRRACGQQHRRAGIHGAAGGHAELRRGAARRRGDLPRAEERAEGQGPEHGGGRRGRLRAEPALQHRGAGHHPRGGQQDRLQGRQRDPARPRRRQLRVLQGRQVRPGRRRQAVQLRAVRRPAGQLGASSTRSSPSRTAWPRATGTAGSC